MFRRLAIATTVSGVLIAGAGTAALINQSHGNAASGPIAAASTTANPAAQTASGPRHRLSALWAGQGQGRLALRLHQGRRVLKVTVVNGSIINATTFASQAVTVTVSATTAYTEAGAAASLSDVHSGSIIAVRGQRTGPRTVQATGIVIELPRVAGVVTAVNGSTLTVTGMDAAPHTVTVTGSTSYKKGGQSAALSDITTGAAIVAQGTLNSDGSLTALRVSIVLPHVAGKVTAVNGATITVSNVWGQTHSVVTTASTTFMLVGARGKAASLANVSVGERVVAAGTLSADGQTLTATRVRIVPQGVATGLHARLKRLITGVEGNVQQLLNGDQSAWQRFLSGQGVTGYFWQGLQGQNAPSLGHTPATIGQNV